MREYVALRCGDEVYCRSCFPRGMDRDGFSHLWADRNCDDDPIEFLPICQVCGREFPGYMDPDVVGAAISLAFGLDPSDNDPRDE